MGDSITSPDWENTLSIVTLDFVFSTAYSLSGIESIMELESSSHILVGYRVEFNTYTFAWIKEGVFSLSYSLIVST